MATLREELAGFKATQEGMAALLDEVRTDQKVLLKTSHGSPCIPVDEVKKGVRVVHGRIDSLSRAFMFGGILLIILFLAGILYSTNGTHDVRAVKNYTTEGKGD